MSRHIEPPTRIEEDKREADRTYPVVQAHTKTALPGDKQGASKLHGTASTSTWANYPVEDAVKPRTVSRRNAVGPSSLHEDLQEAVSKTRLPCLVFAVLLGIFLGCVLNDGTAGGSIKAPIPVSPYQHVFSAIQRAWNLQFSCLDPGSSGGKGMSAVPVKEDYFSRMGRMGVFALGFVTKAEQQPFLTIVGVNLTVLSAVLIAQRVRFAGIFMGVQSSIKESIVPKASLYHQMKSLLSWFLICRQIMAHVLNTFCVFILAYACCHLWSVL